MRHVTRTAAIVFCVLAAATRLHAQVTFAATPPTGLMAAYAMNDGKDASGNNRTATLTAATTAPGKYGSAQRFTGSAPSHMTIPTFNVGNAFTLEAWVFLGGASTRIPSARGGTGYWQAIIYKSNDDFFINEFGDGFFTVGFRNATGVAGGKDGVLQLVNPTGLPSGAWHHLAGTYDGTTLRLFIDGVQTASMPATGVVVPGTAPIEVGGSVADAGWLGGLVDDVRIYNRALSASEIATDMGTAVDTVRETVVSWEMEAWTKATIPANGQAIALTVFPKSVAACNLAPLPGPNPPVLTVSNPSKARFGDPDVPMKECELIIQDFITALPVGVGYTTTLRSKGMTTISDRSGPSNEFDRTAAAVAPASPGSPVVR